MSSDKIYVYCDASFSKAHEVAVIGHALFRGVQEHETICLSEVKINIMQIQESNNIRAEIRAAIAALKYCRQINSQTKTILLYSDCQTVCGLKLRREKLERTKYVSVSKNRLLANADLYREFYEMCDCLNPEITWVKGHSPIALVNRTQSNFSILDKVVRKNLRRTIANGCPSNI